MSHHKSGLRLRLCCVRVSSLPLGSSLVDGASSRGARHLALCWGFPSHGLWCLGHLVLLFERGTFFLFDTLCFFNENDIRILRIHRTDGRKKFQRNRARRMPIEFLMFADCHGRSYGQRRQKDSWLYYTLSKKLRTGLRFGSVPVSAESFLIEVILSCFSLHSCRAIALVSMTRAGMNGKPGLGLGLDERIRVSVQYRGHWLVWNNNVSDKVSSPPPRFK